MSFGCMPLLGATSRVAKVREHTHLSVARSSVASCTSPGWISSWMLIRILVTCGR